MPVSKTDIANQALGYIGVGSEIQDLDNETSAEATACRRFYQTSVDESLRDFRWPFADVTEALALVQDFTAVAGSEWAYSYRYPANCAAMRRILNGMSRIETTRSRVPFKLASDNSGLLVYTDMPSAVAEFTRLDIPASSFPPDVVSTIAYLLASKIAARFGADAVKLGDRALKLYAVWRSAAQANALMESSPDEPAESEFIRARNGGYDLPRGRHC